MDEPKIIIPSHAAGKTALLLPGHVVREREREREKKRQAAQLRKARVDMVNKAQGQLAELSTKAKKGVLSPEERREANFLANVATGGACRRERRRALRKMGLLASQGRRIT